MMIENSRFFTEDPADKLSDLDEGSIDLVVTAPPSYSEDRYSMEYLDHSYCWDSLSNYLEYMEKVFTEVYHVLKNQHYCIIVAGDQTYNNKAVVLNSEKIPLPACFTAMLIKIGFSYLSEVVWDKGGYENPYVPTAPRYPYNVMPKNCCEHILIFSKRKINYNRIPCPYRGGTYTSRACITQENARQWRCENPDCPGRVGLKGGKTFSEYSIMVNDCKTEENIIPVEVIDKWHRNIVKIEPRSRSYAEKYRRQRFIPMEIIEMAMRYFSGVDDLVLDPFVGIGRTMFAAVKLNRKYVCFERDTNNQKVMFGEAEFLQEEFTSGYPLY